MTDKAQFQTVADQVARDGHTFAAKALERARGSPDLALALLGVAAGRVIEQIDETRRAEVLRKWLASFGRSPG